VQVLVREISASPAEFARGLREAFPAESSGGPLVFQVQAPDASMEIELVPGPTRTLASLRLPTLTAHIRFLSGTPTGQHRLLRHMDLAMQRGGG